MRDAVELFASRKPSDEVNLRTVAIVDADTLNEVDPVQPGRLDGACIPHRHRIEISERASVRVTTHHELCHAIDVTHGLAPRLPILREPEVHDYTRAQRPFQARRPDREVFALLRDRGLRDAFSVTQPAFNTAARPARPERTSVAADRKCTSNLAVDRGP